MIDSKYQSASQALSPSQYAKIPWKTGVSTGDVDLDYTDGSADQGDLATVRVYLSICLFIVYLTIYPCIYLAVCLSIYRLKGVRFRVSRGPSTSRAVTRRG